MIRILGAFAIAQLLDLATYLQAPHLEANPVMADVVVAKVVLVKLLLIGCAGAMVLESRTWSLRGRAHHLLEAGLLFGVAWGAFAAGTNVATVAMLAALAS